MAGCTAAAYAIGRHTRQIEKQQHKEELRTWEDEGGHLAAPETAAIGVPRQPREPRLDYLPLDLPERRVSIKHNTAE